MTQIEIFNACMVVAAFVGTLSCFLVYLPRVDWRNPVGANAMAWIMVALLAFGLAMARLFYGSDAWWFEHARGSLYMLMNAAIYWRLALLIRAAHQGRIRSNDRQPAEHEEKS